MTDPFAALGLSGQPELTDDDIRAAWRRVAAATHPDRADGGDPEAFAAAAAAYSELRTGFGRNEALADLRAPARRPPVVLGRLAWRLPVAVAAGVVIVLIAGWQPATPALLVGLATWLVRSSARLGARGLRPVRVGDPGRPGADVERGRDPGQGQREDLV
jgi:hypothetical protein